MWGPSLPAFGVHGFPRGTLVTLPSYPPSVGVGVSGSPTPLGFEFLSYNTRTILSVLSDSGTVWFTIENDEEIRSYLCVRCHGTYTHGDSSLDSKMTKYPTKKFFRLEITVLLFLDGMQVSDSGSRLRTFTPPESPVSTTGGDGWSVL